MSNILYYFCFHFLQNGIAGPFIILFLFSFLTEWNSWSVYYIIFVFYFLQNGIAGPFIILFCFLFLTEWNSWSVLVRCWNNDKYIYISNILCTV